MASCIPRHTASPVLTNGLLSHHITSDLPCAEDKDNDLSMPSPSYLPEHIPEIQGILSNFVPPELADIIIDMAEIWPYAAISRNSYTPAITALEGADGNAQWCYLVSPPVPPLVQNREHLPTVVRKVGFHFKSYNSRWGGGGDGSEAQKGEHLKTWFEASVLKADDPDVKPYQPDLHPHDWFKGLSGDRPKLLNTIPSLDPPEDNAPEPQPNPFDGRKRWPVMDNVHPDAEWHEISWNKDNSDFVNELSVGDRIVLMVRASTPGWLKTVFNAKLDIYYSLPISDDP